MNRSTYLLDPMKKTSLLTFLFLFHLNINAAILFTENFNSYSDGSSSVSGMVFDPARYQVATDTTFGTDKVLVTSDTQQNVTGYFSSTPLSTSSYLVLHVNYRWTAAPTIDPQGNFIRMGLFNSGGTQATGHTDTVFLDDTGYLTDATYYSSQFGHAIRQENSISNAFHEILLDTLPTTDIAQIGSDVSKSQDNGTDFDILSLRLLSTGSGVQVETFFEDETFSGPAALTQIDTTDTVTNFDSFFVRAAGSFGSANFQIEKIRVETVAVPEPSQFGMLVGLAGLWLILARRKGAR